MKQSYLFGPVPSRRLGVSLGIDLVPFKTCTLNCVYCECGHTADLTVIRKEYVPVQMVFQELDLFLQNKPALDFITLAGSGEPTLHKNIDQVIDYVKDQFPQYPVCLLTNGTLFTFKHVREQISRVDLIIPSLDAATEQVFQLLNRPHPELKCEDIISGLAALRQEYRGEICLEIFIIPGLNNTLHELNAIRMAIKKINPDRVQLGTLDRPGAEEWIKRADTVEMQEIATYLGGRVELIGNYNSTLKDLTFNEDYRATIIQILRRRPCTLQDLCGIIGIRPAELQKYIRHLLEVGLVETEKENRGTFVKIKKPRRVHTK